MGDEVCVGKPFEEELEYRESQPVEPTLTMLEFIHEDLQAILKVLKEIKRINVRSE